MKTKKYLLLLLSTFFASSFAYAAIVITIPENAGATAAKEKDERIGVEIERMKYRVNVFLKTPVK